MNNWTYKFPFTYVSIAFLVVEPLQFKVTKRLNFFSYWFIRLTGGNKTLIEMSAEAYIQEEQQRAAMLQKSPPVAWEAATPDDVKDKVFS